MQQLDLTLASAQENLALDEALLDACEQGKSTEVLRFWEPARHFVVVGYANHVATEVNVEVCRRYDIPILRRCSGGGTVLQGPWCLDFLLVLKIESESAVQTIPATNDYIMERHARVL